MEIDVKNIEVETNGLGEIIEIDKPWNGNEHQIYSKLVYFRPNNGAKIEKITWVKTYHDN